MQEELLNTACAKNDHGALLRAPNRLMHRAAQAGYQVLDGKFCKAI